MRNWAWGSIWIPYVWILSVFVTGASLGLCLFKRNRRRARLMGVTLVSASIAAGIPLIEALRPPQPPSVMHPLVDGTFVRLTFRVGTTSEQENSFFCQYLYSPCTEAGHALREGVESIVRTGEREVTVQTTPEFTRELLNSVRQAPIIEDADSGTQW